MTSASTGFGGILRLHLRLVRRSIASWTASYLVLIPASVAAVRQAYPDQAALDARAELLDNPAAVMMTGPAFALEHYTFWAMVANELFLYLLLPAAIMSVLLVVRLTRAEEESGRAELLVSLPTGRLAPPLAAACTLLLADLALGAATTAGLLIESAPPADALVVGTATGLTGLVFGAVAAVCAQISEHAGSASGMALGTIALAFVLRGFGDAIDRQGSWLSWTSPFAWAQQTRVLVDLRLWPLLPSIVAAGLLLAAAGALHRRRDLGAGLRSARPGRPRARRGLLSPQGLAVRLLAPSTIAWTVGLALFGVGFGTLATSIQDMIDAIPSIGDWVPLDHDALVASFAGYALALVALGPTGLLISGLLRLRTEELSGRLAAVLLGGGSRIGLVLRWAGAVLLGVIASQALLGLSVGLGVVAATGEGRWAGELLLLALLQLPAIAVHGGLAIALHGWFPRAAPLTWILLIWSATVMMLGDLLGLPDALLDLSPFQHAPMQPGATTDLAPAALLLALAAVLTGIGLIGIRRRDLVTG
ncbi:ABC transporter permease [Brachybacterium sp. DNPG3]